MNKLVLLLFFTLLSLSYIFKIDRLIVEKFNFISSIKESYQDNASAFQDFRNKYFSQAQSIEEYKKENEILKKYQFLYTKNQYDYDQLLKINTIKEDSNKFELVKVLSYVKFDDFSKVWLNKEKTSEKILALIDNDFTAGIVVKSNNRSLALLNGNEKANYAVFIGKNNVPGIVHKNEEDEKYLKIKYIPIWMDISIGDEVISSGMDNIFFRGLKVGKVIKINKMPDMQEAIIQAYSQVREKKYFYTYENIEEKKEILKTNKKP
ncbi:MAG: rod shape-determining protein MreC [Campylobacterales bacterium]|nr:rod shape-determining protein MreC [Campylobacterales bacterium]